MLNDTTRFSSRCGEPERICRAGAGRAGARPGARASCGVRPMQAGGRVGARGGQPRRVAADCGSARCDSTHAWWRSWRFAWVPAAALAACAVASTIFVHMRHVEQNAETTKFARARDSPGAQRRPAAQRHRSAAGARGSCAAVGCACVCQVPGAKLRSAKLRARRPILRRKSLL